MKKLLLILCIAANGNFMQAQGQNLPYIGTTTIIPQNPTSSDIIKIVTMVTTPNLGTVVAKSHNVNSTAKTINIYGCYWSGWLTAIENYTDTFTIGQLAPGTYTIYQRAYLSSTMTTCVKTSDSNMVVLNLTVSGLTTGLRENKAISAVQFFPNPAKELLYLKNSSGYLNAQIYSPNGSFIRNEDLSLNSEINIKELPAGLYFIRFRNEDRSEVHKFVKEN